MEKLETNYFASKELYYFLSESRYVLSYPCFVTATRGKRYVSHNVIIETPFSSSTVD